MSNKTQTYELSQSFVVCRDGDTIDVEWLQAHVAAERKEMLAQCGKQALRGLWKATGTIGKGIVAVYDAIPSENH